MKLKVKMRTIHLLMLICLAILSSGCDRNVSQASTLPAPSATASSTAALPAKTATATPVQVTETLTPSEPTPTQTPIQQTLIPEPISQTGPWMMLSPNIFYTGPSRTIGPIFSNADGSGWEPANLPRDPHRPPDELEWWFASIAPKGPYVTFEDYISEYSPYCVPESSKVDQWETTLYILKLPENKVVRQVPLFGPQSSEQIQKDECRLVEQGLYDTPPVLGVVNNESSVSWSPDGRYLAFPAAPEGYGADLYLYDTLTDNLRRLTTRQNNPDILGWSPDGQTIIYRSITKMNLFHLQFMESSGLYAVSLSGSDRLLLEPDGLPYVWGWLSQSQFLITDGPCDFPGGDAFCATQLRLVDLSTGGNEILYRNSAKAPFGYRTDYAGDPIHHLLLITNPPADMPGLAGTAATPDKVFRDLAFVKGIYQYDFQTRSLQPALAEDISSLIWYPDLQAFRADYGTVDAALIRYIPGQGFQVEDWIDLSDTSPDGQWSMGKIGEDWFILDVHNQPVQKLQGYWGSWAPDSSAYVELDYTGKLADTTMTIYLKRDNWRPTLARHILYGQYWSYHWIRP